MRNFVVVVVVFEVVVVVDHSTPHRKLSSWTCCYKLFIPKASDWGSHRRVATLKDVTLKIISTRMSIGFAIFCHTHLSGNLNYLRKHETASSSTWLWSHYIISITKHTKSLYGGLNANLLLCFPSFLSERHHKDCELDFTPSMRFK